MTAGLDSDYENFTIGRETYAGGYFSFNGNINDVRIYDHVLSPREVKEISKGLVLHYPLSDPYIEGTTNLYATLAGVTTGCYNWATGKYGYGANTDIYKTTGTFNGKNSLKIYMGTSGASARPYVYFGNLFTSNGTNAPEYKTLSFDYYGTIGTYINFYKLGSGSGTGTWRNVTTSSTGTFTNSGNVTVAPNQWNHIELVLHGTTDANAEWGYGILGDTHTSNTANYWLFANVQLETKDHATGFANYGTTRAASTTVYDTSGFCNNGTINGSLTVSSDTPRYGVSTKFDTTSTKIRLPVMSFSGMANSYTFAWWQYNVSTGNMPWGFSDGNRINLYHCSPLCWNTGDGSSNQFKDGNTTISPTTVQNRWHHMVITGDGTETKLYIDGEYKGTATIYKALTGTQIWISGWDSSGSYTFSGSKISDFRIYSTVFSSDDILELYHTSASLADNGTLMAY